jgi:hypothetical protein
VPNQVERRAPRKRRNLDSAEIEESLRRARVLLAAMCGWLPAAVE